MIETHFSNSDNFLIEKEDLRKQQCLMNQNENLPIIQVSQSLSVF